MGRSGVAVVDRVAAKKAFVASLGDSGNVSAASAAAQISRQTAYEWRADDEAFAAQWDAEVEAGLDKLELAATGRALETSDTLAIFLLKSKRRAVFGDQSRIEHTGANGGPIQVTEVPTDAERASELAAILKAAGTL